MHYVELMDLSLFSAVRSLTLYMEPNRVQCQSIRQFSQLRYLYISRRPIEHFYYSVSLPFFVFTNAYPNLHTCQLNLILYRIRQDWTCIPSLHILNVCIENPRVYTQILQSCPSLIRLKLELTRHFTRPPARFEVPVHTSLRRLNLCLNETMFSCCDIIDVFLSFRHQPNVHTFPMFIKLLCLIYTLFITIFSEQLQPPIILRESSDDDVSIGSRKVFTCNAIGYPSPTYMWLREWKNLTTNFSSSTYFEITSAKKQDQGSYRCLAKNDVGIVASKASYLTIWYFDNLISNQRDQYINVYESDAIILYLPIINSSPEPTIQWFMKSSSLSRDNKRIISNEKYFITSTYNLVILNTEYQDEKIYYAIIENIFVGGTKQTSDYRLQINRRKTSFQLSSIPEFIIKPIDQLATIGDPIKSFECVVNTG
ncbi:unnamed protein product [Rotaria sp. Silwood1]|nr:unnamed protein product [Rotaria sp. Silwood1]